MTCCCLVEQELSGREPRSPPAFPLARGIFPPLWFRPFARIRSAAESKNKSGGKAPHSKVHGQRTSFPARFSFAPQHFSAASVSSFRPHQVRRRKQNRRPIEPSTCPGRGPHGRRPLSLRGLSPQGQ